MAQPLRSSQLLNQLYRRYQLRRTIGLLILLFLSGVLGVQLMLTAGLAFTLQPVSLNVLFTFLLLGAASVVGNYLYAWLSDGVTSRRFFHQWEAHHQDVAHRTDLVVYSQSQPDEIKRLGYSEELIHAEDDILIKRLEEMALNSDLSPVKVPLALLVIVVVSSAIMWAVKGDALSAEAARISQALVVYDAPVDRLALSVPEVVRVKRGEPITLTADIQGDPRGRVATLHREFRSGWESIGVGPQDGRVEFPLPSLNREMVYYISIGEVVSNRGTALPLDPPALTKGSIVIQPPDYTKLPEETINHWRTFSAPRGSHVIFSGVPSAALTAATATWQGGNYPLNVNADVYAIEIDQVHHSGEFVVAMQDENGMIGQTPTLQVEMIEDATPQVDVLAPPEYIDIPGGMSVGVSAHIKDDYGARFLMLHSMLNNDETTRKEELAWKYSQDQTASINDGKDFYVNFEWNIAPFEMYPGDELTFFLDVYDEDPFRGPKTARSKTHTIRYPSLLDLIGELNQEEESHVQDLNEILAEQRDIRSDLDDTLERIAEKSETQGVQDQGEEPFWMEKQELEAIKDRQKDLIEEAKRIEEELDQYQQSAGDELTPEEQQEQGFTPDTLEKLERVQELMKEMVDQQSQQLMQQMDSVIEQLSQEMDAEQLQDLDFAVDNFEEQLDRTLSMLESTYQFRQLEGVRQTAQELAQRQDHLMRETQQLEQDVSGLQSEIQQLEQQAEQLAQQQNQDGQDNAQSGEQNPSENQDAQSGENNEAGENQDGQSGEKTEEQKRVDQEIQQKKDELAAKQNMLAQRQKRLQEDTEAMMKQMEQLREDMQESNPMLAQQMEQMLEQLQENQTMQQMNQAVQQLQSGQPQQAQQNQQKALESLQQMSQQMENQMANMGMQNMEQDANQIKRLVDRGLFLSNEMEGLTESVMGQSEALAALRVANAYLKEIRRVRTVWKGVAAQNPFLNRRSDQLMQQSEARLREAVEAGQGVKWLGLHEARQSLIALNQALRQMMQDNQEMQQQMQQQQSSMQSFQQQMQQMMMQQQTLNQMMQQLKQQGEQGEKMAQQLKRMAQQQARIRKEIEKMMQKHRHARQLKNRLEGIYDEMREVEKLLEAGESGEEVEERQQRIMTRMLEAGTMQEEDQYGKERREEAPEGVQSDSPTQPVETDWQDAVRKSLEQPLLESIPAQYRDAIKNHYIRLSEEALPG